VSKTPPGVRNSILLGQVCSVCGTHIFLQVAWLSMHS